MYLRPPILRGPPQALRLEQSSETYRRSMFWAGIALLGLALIFIALAIHFFHLTLSGRVGVSPAAGGVSRSDTFPLVELNGIPRVAVVKPTPTP